MSRNIAGTLLRLFVLSLIVGIVLSVLDVEPENLLGTIGGTAEAAFRWLVSALEWAIPFVLVGAVIVVPVWLVLAAFRYVRRR